MDFCFVRFLLILVFTDRISALPLGCSYNGTEYKEGDPVVTEEPCLSCVCRRSALSCTLRVCGDVPEVLDPGCFLVHKPNDCCPQLLCEEDYVQNGVQLRTAFKLRNQIPFNGCLINGSIYAEGSAVASSEICEYCYCIQSEMKCIKPQCFQPFEGCKPVYKDSSCCPMHYDCRHPVATVLPTDDNYGCEKEGIHYLEGEMVKPSNGSECETCYCMKGEIQCAPIVCSMDHLKDCQPLTIPGQCCPSSFTCANTSTSTTDNIVETVSTLQTEVEHKTTEYAQEREDSLDEKESTTLEGTSTTETLETDETTFLSLYKTEGNSSFSGFQETEWQNVSTERTGSLTEESPTEESTTLSFELSPLLPEPLHFLKETKDVLETRTEDELEFEVEKEALKSQISLDEIQRNSSEGVEDYDAYDYGEPKLPPSLPNLVIYPFVAADAVVKEEAKHQENTKKPFEQEESSVKRMDVQELYYKDLFSPPVQTEGGFVPKEPSAIIDSFLRSPYFNKNENVIATTNVDNDFRIIPYTTVLPKITVESDTSEIFGSHVTRVDHLENLPEIPLVTPPPLTEVIKTEKAPNFSFPPYFSNQQTAKPVTVTFKNVAVEYYPDYLITTSRNNFKTKNLLNGNEQKIPIEGKPVETGQHTPLKNNKDITMFVPVEVNTVSQVSEFSVTVPVTQSSTTKMTTVPTQISTTTTTESSFFEFFKKVLTEDVKTTTKSNNKYKFSSKIKTTTATPKQNESNKNTSTTSYSFFDFLFNQQDQTAFSSTVRPTNKTKIYNSKVSKKDNNKKLEKVATTENLQEMGSSQFEGKHSQIKEEHLEKSSHSQEEIEDGKTVQTLPGNLLKLAGCNIYGRMYRVGKIIFELSGPCLECVCTDLGVQCKQLNC